MTWYYRLYEILKNETGMTDEVRSFIYSNGNYWFHSMIISLLSFSKFQIHIHPYRFDAYISVPLFSRGRPKSELNEARLE